MKKFFADFKQFINKGNIVDLAVGVIIGSAFNKIVTSLVNDILMPLITYLFGANSLADLSIPLRWEEVIEEGELVRNVTLSWNYGNFLQSIIDFLIVALCLFILIKALMKSQKVFDGKVKELKESKPTKEEKEILKARGVNLKNNKEMNEELNKIRAEAQAKIDAEKAAAEANKPAPEPTELDVLKEIKELLKNKQ